MKEVRVGLIGAGGWMGKTHALMYGAEAIAFGPLPARPVLEMVADASEERARDAAAAYGVGRWGADLPADREE